MSYGSDYRDRRQRKRRKELKLLFYCFRSLIATASLVAIAFAFDLPGKIREKLNPQVEQAQVVRQQAQTEAQPSADVNRVKPKSPRVERAPEETNPPAVEVVASDRPSEVAEQVTEARFPPALPFEPQSSVEPNTPIEQRGQQVELQLDERRTRHPIVELSDAATWEGRVRMIGLRGLEETVELIPADGMVEVGTELQVLFPDHPRARIVLRLDKIGQNLFLVAEPQMALWAENPMPFTLTRIKREAFKTQRAGDEFFKSLAAAKSEMSALEAWMQRGTGNKALADVQRAKARVAELKRAIEQMEDRTKTVEQGVAELAALERLAQMLHDRAALHFEVVDNRD